MGQLAQLGYVMQKVLQGQQRDIIVIKIDPGELGALAQGRPNGIEMAVPHATLLQFQDLQGTCGSLKENRKGLKA